MSLENPSKMGDPDSIPVAKACNNCARAKAKCDIASTGKCSRCTRLAKDCAPQQAVRKRKTPRIRRSEQIVQLQETVNGLLAMVGTGQILSHEQAAVSIPSPASLVSSSRSRSTHSGDNRSPQVVHLPVTNPPIQTVVEAPTSFLATVDSVPFFNNSHILLSIFRDRLASQFPFVVIPSHTTIEDLRRDKPMVYMTVVLASSYTDFTTQQEISRLILKYLATNVILEGRKTLDILQGLLVYISCLHYLCHISYQTNNLLGLLFAQLVDLGLKRIPADNEVHESFSQIARRSQGPQGDYGRRNCGRSLTMDEKRSYLGCYYLSSCLSSTSSRMDCLTFSSYITDCCDDLNQAAEYSTDTLFAYLMRLQSLAERQRVGGLWERVNSSDSDTLRAPIGLLVRSYQLELQNFKAKLPLEYSSSPFVLMNYYAAEIRLYEVGFKLSPTTGVVRHDLESLKLTDILYACFQATRSWFDAYFSIPVAQHCTLTIINYGQCFHAIGALYKLSVFEIPEWDTAIVRKTLDLSELLNQIARQLEEVEDLYTGQIGAARSPWAYCASKMRHCKAWWDMTVAQERNHPASGGVWTETMDEELLPFMNFESLGDYFWQTTEEQRM